MHLGRTAREQSFRRKRQNCPWTKEAASGCSVKPRSKHLTSKHQPFSRGRTGKSDVNGKSILTIANEKAEDLQFDYEVLVHQDHPLHALRL